jgi:hypothetical protein
MSALMQPARVRQRRYQPVFVALTHLQAVVQVRRDGNVKTKVHCLSQAPLQSEAEAVDSKSVDLGAACRTENHGRRWF